MVNKMKLFLNACFFHFCSESRYLLFMTENFAALRVLQQHLLRGEDKPPFVLFGSSFPKDMEYTQVTHMLLNYISSYKKCHYFL